MLLGGEVCFWEFEDDFLVKFEIWCFREWVDDWKKLVIWCGMLVVLLLIFKLGKFLLMVGWVWGRYGVIIGCRWFVVGCVVFVEV